jgi:hypothetical protein
MPLAEGRRAARGAARGQPAFDELLDGVRYGSGAGRIVGRAKSRDVLARAAATIGVVLLLLASLAGAAHTHACRDGWGNAPKPCAACVFKQHTPSAGGVPPSSSCHLGVAAISLDGATIPASFAPPFSWLSRAPPGSALLPRS